LARVLDLGADGEAAEPNLTLKDRKRSHKELEALLKHELIHYQLKDRGDVYHGHGAAFLKRAQALGIVNSYVLQRCFSAEEFEHTPTVRKSKKIPLARFKRQVDRWFEQLLVEVGKLPDPHSVKLYPYVQNAYVGWTAFSAAVKAKSHYVLQEIWRVRKGPHVKGLHELQTAYAELQQQRQALIKKSKSGGKASKDRTVVRQIKAIEAQQARIRKQLAKDYGISLN
jgi:hypothetical protein